VSRLVHRLIVSVGLLVAVSIAGFAILPAMPGDAAEVILMERMDGEIPTREALAAFRADAGFDDIWPVQYLRWLAGVLQGDLGTSFRTDDPVLSDLALALPRTLMLGTAAALVSVMLALPLGIAAALRPGTWIDRLAMALAVVGMATPNFWLALLGMLLFSLTLGWLPVSGHGTWLHLVLPALVVGTALTGVLARMVRSALLEVLGADFIRTARAKGLHPARVVLAHAFPNAAAPVLTVLGLHLGKMFDSIVVVEAVFGWPGLGRLLVDAILARDGPVIQGCLLVIGTATVVIHLLTDIAVNRVDPRAKGAV